jgi:hypothetical protein
MGEAFLPQAVMENVMVFSIAAFPFSITFSLQLS